MKAGGFVNRAGKRLVKYPIHRVVHKRSLGSALFFKRQTFQLRSGSIPPPILLSALCITLAEQLILPFGEIGVLNWLKQRSRCGDASIAFVEFEDVANQLTKRARVGAHRGDGYNENVFVGV